jgi:mRNA interferase RelE/StbE
MLRRIWKESDGLPLGVLCERLMARLTKAPLSFGAPLAGNLAGFRKLRIGDYRVVYKVREHQVLVFVLAIGHRRDMEIYRTALDG